jgi:hypothetical protein
MGFDSADCYVNRRRNLCPHTPQQKHFSTKEGVLNVKNTLFIISFILFIVASLAFSPAKSRKDHYKGYSIQLPRKTYLSLDYLNHELHASARTDTFHLAEFTFDDGPACVSEGWTSHDRSAQDGSYFHIDDFAGLNGGDFGGLVPLEGNQSLWCGARQSAGDPALCGYGTLPGYGNDWDQSWSSSWIGIPQNEMIFLDYLLSFDTEPGYDYIYVEYVSRDSLWHVDSLMSDEWTTIQSYDGDGGGQTNTASDTIPTHSGSNLIRFRFESDIGWSDEDGLWNTDGAVIIDDITVSASNGVIYEFENFEDESIGDLETTDEDWECVMPSGAGDFAGMYAATSQIFEDHCWTNASCYWSFINGSTAYYNWGGYPEQRVVPYANENEPYINDEIWSPPIPWIGSGSAANLSFDVYEDLDAFNCVFYRWQVRSIDHAGCPSLWRSRNSFYYGASKRWARKTFPIGDLIDANAASIQVALGVIDLCGLWAGQSCRTDCGYTGHTHSPVFDNVRIDRIQTHGPQWSAVPAHLFQDNFPENGELTGTARIDMASDILHASNAGITAGDSAVISCKDIYCGIAEPDPNTNFGSAVYFYLRRHPLSKPMPASEIVEDGFRWPFVGEIDFNGNTWHQFRMDTCFTGSSGSRTGPVPNRWCIDINDHFFEQGDTLYYFFGAQNTNGEWTYWSDITGTFSGWGLAISDPMEVQILPGGGAQRGGDILYVDKFDGYGAQPYYDFAFEIMGIDGLVDRYDVRDPSACAGNGLASRASLQQLQPYKKIVWNSGGLSVGNVGDGYQGNPCKENDFDLLNTFLDSHPDSIDTGIYFSGNDLAEELDQLTGASAQSFIGTWIPHQLITSDHKIQHGFSPLTISEAGSFFNQEFPIPQDTIIAYGGCPVFHDFDQIEPLDNSEVHMTYGGTHDATDGAVIAHSRINSLGNTASVVLSGFSFHQIRDDRVHGHPDRVDHLLDIIRFLGNIIDDPVGIGIKYQFTNSLSQNYPNPFNPTTTIKYTIKNPAHVTLKIYNVAGQLVKILANEEKKLGEYTLKWNGRSNSGDPVSTGIYFYKLVTKDFTKTKKMVLLK